MIILQGEIDVNRAWEISPYNGLAYGALIVLLCVVIIYLKKEYDKAQIYIKEQSERIHTILTETVDKVSEFRQDKELKHEKVMNVLENIMTQLKRIDKE
jgi:hypothetical protein